MKTRKTIKNSVTATIVNIIVMVIGFISQAFFINILGVEYLGLNGLFSNILNMLNIFELGIGSAITYSLYKPIVNSDKKTISSIMNFYKKIYCLISFIVLSSGLIILPFIQYFVGETSVDINIRLVFILYLIGSASSYLLSYKRNILYANQNNYIISIVHVFYIVLLNVVQIIAIYVTKNFYFYLLIKIALQLLENVVIYFITKKMYPYLDEYKNEKIDKQLKNDIFRKVKALFMHKISSFIVLGTDNIVISKFLSLSTVGLYSNYYLIISSLTSLFNQVISSATASVGNALVNSNVEKNFSIFTKLRFLNFYLSTLSSSFILILMDPFITAWIGQKYVLSFFVLVVLCINYFQTTMRCSYNTFKEAAGIWVEDRFIPLFEAITNIISSIILVRILGLPGVFIGTFISSLLLWLYSYPKLVYCNLMGRTKMQYLKETVGYFALYIFIMFFTYKITALFTFSSLLIEIIIKLMTGFLLMNILIIFTFLKNDNFKYYIELIKRIVVKK